MQAVVETSLATCSKRISTRNKIQMLSGCQRIPGLSKNMESLAEKAHQKFKIKIKMKVNSQ